MKALSMVVCIVLVVSLCFGVTYKQTVDIMSNSISFLSNTVNGFAEMLGFSIKPSTLPLKSGMFGFSQFDGKTNDVARLITENFMPSGYLTSPKFNAEAYASPYYHSFFIAYYYWGKNGFWANNNYTTSGIVERAIKITLTIDTEYYANTFEYYVCIGYMPLEGTQGYTNDQREYGLFYVFEDDEGLVIFKELNSLGNIVLENCVYKPDSVRCAEWYDKFFIVKHNISTDRLATHITEFL